MTTHRYVFGTISALLVVAAVFVSEHAPENRTSEQRHAPTARAVPALGWWLADGLLAARSSYRRALGRDDLPEWSQYTRAYFQQLTARRNSVIAWAGEQERPPRILFLGLIHVNPDGSTPPERQAEIAAIQDAVYERLRTGAPEASVIAIEQSGTDEVLTPQVYLQLAKVGAREIYGQEIDGAVLSEIMRQDPQASTRAILELRQPPIICGEEWPIMMETRIRMLAPPADPAARAEVENMIQAFDFLRTEIILIRSLEYLRRTNGSMAIILQGDAHRDIMRHIAPEYHVAFRGIPPL